MGAAVADSNVPFLSTIEGEYQLNKEMAKATEADAKYNADQRRRQANRLMGEQVAAFGTSGVELEGTPMEMIRADLVDAEQEAMNIIYSGKQQSAAMMRKASMARKGAYQSLAKDGLMMAASSGAFSGGGGAATSAKGMDTRSTGTKGFTMSESGSSTGYGSRGLA